MRAHVGPRPREPPGIEQGDAGQEHAEMADDREGEQALEVPLQEAHRRAHERGQDSCAQEHRTHGARLARERAREDRPVDAGERVDPEVAHHSREHDADRRRRDGIGIGEPEVEGDRGRLDQEARGE